MLSALRRLVQAGDVEPDRAAAAIEDLGLLRLVRHDHITLAARAWELRHNLTAYDAVYVALAESLEAPLVTCDRPLAAAARSVARVELIR